jgi:hypothetical protein
MAEKMHGVGAAVKRARLGSAYLPRFRQRQLSRGVPQVAPQQPARPDRL